MISGGRERNTQNRSRIWRTSCLIRFVGVVATLRRGRALGCGLAGGGRRIKEGRRSGMAGGGGVGDVYDM